jgi:N-formylglutamate amidohydrolase
MSTVSEPSGGTGQNVEIVRPERRTVPLVFASPHSGRNYPADFVAASALDPVALRRSEDSFVDELFAAAPEFGAPLLKALFPRAFIDPNREPFELDPAMFVDELPSYANSQSSRVAAGLGTIPKVVSNGREIYRAKLTFAEAAKRINVYYRPYHKALTALIDETVELFGFCVLIDCHSMPSVGGPLDPDAGRGRADFVLGDSFGNACEDRVTATVEHALRVQGHSVIRNKPFAGGFTTRHYGKPSTGVHALQIEINRALYMDELNIERRDGIHRLTEQMVDVIVALTGLSGLGGLDLAAE